MTKDEALRLALEALEKLFGIPDKWTGEGEGDVAVWRLGGSYRAQQAITAIKAALEAKDEPVAWWIPKHKAPDMVSKVRWSDECEPLYTTPPQRTWVGLTDEDEIPWDGVDAKSFARAIEAKLKEKNT